MLIQCAGILLAEGHEVCLAGSPSHVVREWAEAKGLPYFDPRQGWNALSGQTFDYLFSIGNLIPVPESVLGQAGRYAVNFHDGPLPAYAGLNAPVWALLNREREHGVTWHIMEPRIDSGDILRERSIPISDDETALTLNAKCYEAGIESFRELIADLEGQREVRRKQPGAGRRYFPKRKRPDGSGVISWNADARDIARFVRALDFGPYENPLCLPKVIHDDEVFAVSGVRVLESRSGSPPGTILASAAGRLEVATRTTSVALARVQSLDGIELSAPELLDRFQPGGRNRFRSLPGPEAVALGEVHESLAAFEDFWVDQLAGYDPLDTEGFASGGQASAAKTRILPMRLPPEIKTRIREAFPGTSAEECLASAFAAFLGRMTGRERFDLAWSNPALESLVGDRRRFFSGWVPLRVEIPPRESFRRFHMAQAGRVRAAARHKTFARDAILRYPSLSKRFSRHFPFASPVGLEFGDAPGEASLRDPLRDVTFVIGDETCRWVYKMNRLARSRVSRMRDQFRTFLDAAISEADRPIAELPLTPPDAGAGLSVPVWNDTTRAYEGWKCIHELIEVQAARTPDRVAVVSRGRSLTYAELNKSANQLARRLSREGVGPEVLVGIGLDRSLDMIVAVLGVMKAGGAWLPLDPSYPPDRLRFMLEDSSAPFVLTTEELQNRLDFQASRVLCMDAVADDLTPESGDNLPIRPGSENLAYVLYTSGSTGKPKGVMIEHRNVVNFFAGMDDRIPHDPPGVWLAVSSLSFDISVLELFWTLARGFEVVLYAGEDRNVRAAGIPDTGNPIEFSLSYFASGESEAGSDKYRLLLEGARFADRNGFTAIWVPERHLHAFGGLYPNPSVVGAALAAATERVRIRAGSVVLPLHHPIRVAEEWSVVDNLSGGRVDVSFASGWHPHDFVLSPGNFADGKRLMFEQIETVRKLWRGETVEFAGPDSKLVDVRTLPRPVQPELPVWITAAGNPETFRMAGRIGANLLTHLLGQRIDELAVKINVYRAERGKAGWDPATGHVTLMVHTFIGDTIEEVRETVRRPMKEYLRSAMHLVRKAAWSFPTMAQKFDGQDFDTVFESLPAEEVDALLDFSFERYFATSGLFGTPDSLVALSDSLQAAGVNEIASLVDFGVDSGQVLAHLPRLAELKDRVASGREVRASESIPALIERYGVTHLQCTPTMASLLIADSEGRRALGSLRTMLVGGEALGGGLARELLRVLEGSLVNMYGPTETTIWSTTHAVSGTGGHVVPIGRPIANTLLYVVDENLQPVPDGEEGELLIGGDGVARGYLNRPGMTAERFIPNPFHPDPSARVYRTGDRVRRRPDGSLEFRGRSDQQVKVRGHRIELEEVEAEVNAHHAVRESVVVVREDTSGEKALVAYFIARDPGPVDSMTLRRHLRLRLPEFMIPSHFIQMQSFPETPNRKMDRRALPSPREAAAGRAGETAGRARAAPAGTVVQTGIEKTIRTIWQEALEVATVGRDDNFFDLGGHSLLAVEVLRQLRQALGMDIRLTDVFKYPTVRSLGAHIERAGLESNDQSTPGDRTRFRDSAVRRREARQKARSSAR